MPIDESREFRALGVAIVVVSDTRTLEDDRSGRYLQDALQSAGHRVASRQVVSDDRAAIAKLFVSLAEDPTVDVVLSSGGTGLTGRDVTPEALSDVAAKTIPGFGELFRMLSYESIGTSTIQSRACAALVKGVYVFVLPGSPGACRDAWEKILVHQLDQRFRPCNFAELIPRLNER